MSLNFNVQTSEGWEISVENNEVILNLQVASGFSIDAAAYAALALTYRNQSQSAAEVSVASSETAVEAKEFIEDLLRFEPEIISSPVPVKFDVDYQIGSPFSPIIESNIVIDLSDARIGSSTSIFYFSTANPVFSSSAPIIGIDFDFTIGTVNEIILQYFEDPISGPYIKAYNKFIITQIN